MGEPLERHCIGVTNVQVRGGGWGDGTGRRVGKQFNFSAHGVHGALDLFSSRF